MKLSLIATIAFLCAACASGDKRAEAATSYAGQQAACIAENKTREAIDACRDKVKAAWSTDAGPEGGAK